LGEFEAAMDGSLGEHGCLAAPFPARNWRKLFPICLVDFEAIREWQCFEADVGKDSAVEVREYSIPDFSNWKDHDSFEAAFARLLKDLKVEDSTGAKPAREPKRFR
jgi:hypothetical protein